MILLLYKLKLDILKINLFNNFNKFVWLIITKLFDKIKFIKNKFIFNICNNFNLISIKLFDKIKFRKINLFDKLKLLELLKINLFDKYYNY